MPCMGTQVREGPAWFRDPDRVVTRGPPYPGPSPGRRTNIQQHPGTLSRKICSPTGRQPEFLVHPGQVGELVMGVQAAGVGQDPNAGGRDLLLLPPDPRPRTVERRSVG